MRSVHWPCLVGLAAAVLAAAPVMGLSKATAQAPDLIWASRASMPTPRHGVSAVAASNGRIYVAGGASIFAVGGREARVATVEEYDPDRDTWATKASLPGPRRTFGLFEISPGRLLAIGGSDADGKPVQTVDEYDTSADRWTTRGTIPATGSSGYAFLDGRVFALGPWQYDPRSNTLQALEQLPVSSLWTSLASLSGRLYAVGGLDYPTPRNSLFEYDLPTKRWTAKASMANARVFPGVTTARGKLYVVGGAREPGSTSVEEYDPSTNRWRTLSPLPLAFNEDATAVTARNGRIYIFGGLVRGAAVATHQAVFSDLVVPPRLSDLSASPDPFSPDGDGVDDSTTISYALSKAASVTLRILDPAGTTVRVLVQNGNRGPGPNSEVWDGTSEAGFQLPPGSYTIEVEATDSDGLRAASRGAITIAREVPVVEFVPTEPSFPTDDALELDHSSIEE